MHTSLKNVTERAQKYDFSVNFHHRLNSNFKMHTSLKKEAQKYDFSEQIRPDILCQKVDINRHCVFPLNIALKKTFQL